MPSQDISEILQELSQMQQEENSAAARRRPRAELPPPTPRRAKSPLLDTGLFLVAYFFWLVILVTAEIAVGMGIHPYTCYAALPCAWITLAVVRKAPLYALGVAVFGALILTGAAYLAGMVFDTAWDSNCYHKPMAGMLANGWNPFQQTMIEFANTHDALPYNAGWLPYQVNNQPKASAMIGASIYVLTGNIANGKVFNLVSMLACVFFGASLLKDAFRVGTLWALLIMLLTSANLMTLSQVMLYYNDGFTYQLLTMTFVAFVYLIFKPQGKFAVSAKVTAFMAVCLAVNVKTSAALYVAALCAFYFFGRLAAAGREENRGRELRSMLLYFVLMAATAVCVLGATTYITNALRFGNPFYGMLGSDSINSLLQSLMGPNVQALPLFLQFFGSLFSPMSYAQFAAVKLKTPFTFSQAEWNMVTMDANISGWGILFGGIFLLSAVIVVITAIRMRRSNRQVSTLLIGVLLVVIIPSFFIPYLFVARYYLQPFWVSMAALVCLFAPSIRRKNTGKVKYPKARALKIILAPVLCGLIIVNAYNSFLYLQQQREVTQNTRAQIASIQERMGDGGKTLDVTTITRGLYYGLMFNVHDEGLTYNFVETMRDRDADFFYYMMYHVRDNAPAEDMAANSFLRSLYQNGYVVAIAAHSGNALTETMTRLVQDTGLMAGGVANPQTGYLAVIGPQGELLTEQNVYGTFQRDVNGTQLSLQCTEAAVSITIDGQELASGDAGYNIVVYDTQNHLPVASVTINPGADPVMTVEPVRLTGTP